MSIRYWVPAGILVLGIAGCGGAHEPAAAGEEHAAKEEAHVTVRTEPAKRAAIVEAVEGLGRCEALPDHIATLTPAVEGHVHELLVMQGDPVKKGQPIVELDKAVAQADLAEKTATRDGLKASLALLKSLPRPEERRANELAVEQAKVAVERAKALVESLESLRRDGSLVSEAAALRRREGPGGGPAPAADGRGDPARDDDRPPARGGRRGRGEDQDGRRLGRLLPGPSRLSTRSAHRSTACSTA